MEAQTLAPPCAAQQHAIERIVADAQVDLKDCYQCGKCSAGCPVAPMADSTPREVVRNLQLGLVDRALRSNMPWLCAKCGMCYARCPQSFNMPELLAACRRVAQEQCYVSIPESKQFDSLFIDGVRRKGVSDEAMLAARFNLSTGHFMQDALNAPKMAARGMLDLGSLKTSGNDEVRELIDRARKASIPTQEQEEAQ